MSAGNLLKLCGTLFLIGCLLPLGNGVLMRFSVEKRCTGEPPGQFFKDLDLSWITSLPRLYISYGSLDYWVQNAEACLSTVPINFAVLSEMHMRVEWDLNNTMWCYGSRFLSQECSLNQNNGNPFVSCRVTSHSVGTNPLAFRDFTKRVVLTDNKTYALFVRCSAGRASYYIASPRPISLSNSVLLQSYLAILKMGFNPVLFYKNPSREIDSYQGN